MKLRSIMCVGAIALAASALATDALTDSKTLGWMRVDSTLPITAVGVPWTAVSNTAVNVAVADLVKTDSLSTNDKLYIYDNGDWKMFNLQEVSGVKKWVGSTTVSANSPSGVAAGDDSMLIARGQALYLERQNPTTPGYFYVYGAVGSAITKSTLTGATKYLVASPKATAFTPSSANISGATAKARRVQGDQIVVPLTGGATRTYTYIGDKWGHDVNGSRVEEGGTGYLPIQLGTGFWYITASAANSIEITW